MEIDNLYLWDDALEEERMNFIASELETLR